MMANGLIKTLNKQVFTQFIDILGLNDQRGRLEAIRYQEDLKELLIERRQQKNQHIIAFARCRDLKAVL